MRQLGEREVPGLARDVARALGETGALVEPPLEHQALRERAKCARPFGRGLVGNKVDRGLEGVERRRQLARGPAVPAEAFVEHSYFELQIPPLTSRRRD